MSALGTELSTDSKSDSQIKEEPLWRRFNVSSVNIRQKK